MSKKETKLEQATRLKRVEEYTEKTFGKPTVEGRISGLVAVNDDLREGLFSIEDTINGVEETVEELRHESEVRFDILEDGLEDRDAKIAKLMDRVEGLEGDIKRLDRLEDAESDREDCTDMEERLQALDESDYDKLNMNNKLGVRVDGLEVREAARVKNGLLDHRICMPCHRVYPPLGVWDHAKPERLYPHPSFRGYAKDDCTSGSVWATIGCGLAVIVTCAVVVHIMALAISC